MAGGVPQSLAARCFVASSLKFHFSFVRSNLCSLGEDGTISPSTLRVFQWFHWLVSLGGLTGFCSQTEKVGEMKRFLTGGFLGLVMMSALTVCGCDDGPRQVQETEEYSFDDMAAQAAADSEWSEVEE